MNDLSLRDALSVLMMSMAVEKRVGMPARHAW